ncbi:sugar phosphate isomerase/epimerase family protein [Microbacterium halophytorum]|uniref:sugar phosphate isomerase/epimerase family protein n=1 Tax=Microbacterium halophytorum TaxID=2067568 RepID=UPI000CFD1185|nr:TIM barrel protein [Microbacterium halophytorum]
MIGLGSYAYFWRHSARVDAPLTLAEEFEDARRLGVGLFQICDDARLERMGDAELRDAATAARENAMTIELGTKGVAPERLDRFLRLADAFDARLVRSMVYGPGSRPSLGEAAGWLEQSVRMYEAAGVELALETYEQLPTSDLVGLVERVGSDALGICLDPANVVARLEQPSECIRKSAPHVKNVHAKDFAFARQDGWVGFTYSGAPMGTGLHDYPALLEAVRPRERGANEIVEHWLPWQGDAATTITAERDWTRTALDYLRSTP